VLFDHHPTLIGKSDLRVAWSHHANEALFCSEAANIICFWQGRGPAFKSCGSRAHLPKPAEPFWQGASAELRTRYWALWPTISVGSCPEKWVRRKKQSEL